MPSRKSSPRAPLSLDAIVNRAAPEPEPSADAPKQPARQRAARTQLAAAPMAGEGKRDPLFPHRVTLPLTKDQWQALKQARNDDEIEHSYRVRAAVMLWMQDERLRARIDKLAAQESRRDKERRGYR